MDKISMGEFMARLRRESGMTQRELADRLDVSDKSISRWERDEGAPDLSLIPKIADIFGVTSDELLRGERAARNDTREERESTPPGGNERFKIMCAAALGGVFLALISGMAVNFAFLRAYIGFFVGAAILLIAAVVQLIFTNMALSSAGDDRTEAVRLTDRFFGFAAVILGFLISLLTAGDAYVGLRWWAFLTYGGIFAAILFVLWVVIGSYVFGGMLKGEENAFIKNMRLRRNTVYIMLGVMALTLFAHALATAGWSPSSMADGTRFTDEASFVAYMEQDIPYNNYGYDAPVADPIGEETYYNADGEEISYEEAHTHTVSLGDESFTFIWLNEEVASYRYGGDSIFPITVYTHDDFKAAEDKITVANAIFACVYVMEATAAVGVYIIKRKRDE